MTDILKGLLFGSVILLIMYQFYVEKKKELENEVKE